MNKYKFWKRVSRIEALRFSNTVNYTHIRARHSKDKTLQDWIFVGYYWISQCQDDNWIFEIEITKNSKCKPVWAVHFDSREAARNACSGLASNFRKNSKSIVKGPHKVV